MLTQNEVDAVGKKIAKLVNTYGLESERLARLKSTWETFSSNIGVINFLEVKEELRRVEDGEAVDMSPVFMNI